MREKQRLKKQGMQQDGEGGNDGNNHGDADEEDEDDLFGNDEMEMEIG